MDCQWELYLLLSALESDFLMTKPWKDPCWIKTRSLPHSGFKIIYSTLRPHPSLLLYQVTLSPKKDRRDTPIQAFGLAPLPGGTKFPFQRHVNTTPQEMNQTDRQESCWKKIWHERGNALSIYHLHVTVLFFIPTPSCSIQFSQGFSHLSCLQRGFRTAPARPGFISNNELIREMHFKNTV